MFKWRHHLHFFREDCGKRDAEVTSTFDITTAGDVINGKQYGAHLRILSDKPIFFGSCVIRSCRRQVLTRAVRVRRSADDVTAHLNVTEARLLPLKIVIY